MYSQYFIWMWLSPSLSGQAKLSLQFQFRHCPFFFKKKSLLFVFNFWPHTHSIWNLSSWPGIKFHASYRKMQSLNHCIRFRSSYIYIFWEMFPKLPLLKHTCITSLLTITIPLAIYFSHCLTISYLTLNYISHLCIEVPKYLHQVGE